MPQEAVVYDAQRERENSIQWNKEAVPKIEPVEPSDLLYRKHDPRDVRAELDHWMVLLKADRIAKIRHYTDRNSPLFANPDDSKKPGGAVQHVFANHELAEDARKRYLLLILMKEWLHPEGSREVAEIAFNAVYPKGPKAA